MESAARGARLRRFEPVHVIVDPLHRPANLLAHRPRDGQTLRDASGFAPGEERDDFFVFEDNRNVERIRAPGQCQQLARQPAQRVPRRGQANEFGNS